MSNTWQDTGNPVTLLCSHPFKTKINQGLILLFISFRLRVLAQGMRPVALVSEPSRSRVSRLKLSPTTFVTPDLAFYSYLHKNYGPGTTLFTYA